MMPQDQMPMSQDSKSPELDMIKQALMKVIDDMTSMESDRHLPDGHPMKMKAAVEVKPGDEMSPDADMSGTSDSTGSDDPMALDSLMGDADKADASGAMPDEQDASNGLPPEIMDVVNKKKAAMQLPK